MATAKQTQVYNYLAACFSNDGRLLACFPVLTIREFNKWANENPMYICRLYRVCSFDLKSKFDTQQISMFDSLE